MKIIGHPWIESERFVVVRTIEAIKKSLPASILFAHALGARYILSGEKNAEAFQAVAQHYLFDMEILVLIHHEEEIEKYALMGIDGVIFASSIQREEE